MTHIKTFDVYWRQMNDATFMYGSKVRFESDGVYFSNRLMPSGTVIHEWYMRTNFYQDRAFPALPLLKKGKRYTFRFLFDAQPVGSVYFKIIFMKRNNTEAHSVIVKDKEVEVTLPQDAFDYHIQMMNAACEVLKFHKIEIESQTEETTQANAFKVLETHRARGGDA